MQWVSFAERFGPRCVRNAMHVAHNEQFSNSTKP
jgi:hypothetical protein